MKTMKYRIVVRHYTPDWKTSDDNTDFGDVKLVSESVIYMADSEAVAGAFLDAIEDGAACNSNSTCDRQGDRLTIEMGDPAYADHFDYIIEKDDL